MTGFRGAIVLLAAGLAGCGGAGADPQSTEARSSSSAGAAYQPAPSQSPGPAVATTGTAAAPAAGAPAVVAPNAVDALNRMGVFLRSLKSFQVTAESTRDQVFDDGVRVQFAGRIDMVVERPNRLRAVIDSDLQNRQLFYDGKTFTMYGERVNYYASAPAPPTLLEFVNALQDRYDIELPLTDLFKWGSEGYQYGTFLAAKDVGPSQIGGVSCEHYAYKQENIDWQVWLQQGNSPLPRKIVITSTDNEDRPQYTSVLTWNLAPAYNEQAFVFVPPPGVQRITFAAQAPAPAGTNQ